MKNFIKISVSFLISALSCAPLAAMDWEEFESDDDNYPSLVNSPREFEIQSIRYDEDKDVFIIVSKKGEECESKLQPQDIEKVKSRLAQKDEKSKDDAYCAGQLVKGLVQQCVPGGLMLTAATGAVSGKLLGTETLTEALVGYFTRKIESDVFVGLTTIDDDFSGFYTIKNLTLSALDDANKGLLSCGDAHVEVLQNNTGAYSVNQKCRSRVLWEIQRVNGGYVIKNGYKEQLLTLVRNIRGTNPHSGYYCALQLQGDTEGDTYQDDILWDIYYDDALKKYVLTNKGANPGFLCYAETLSANGCRAEILSASWPSRYKGVDYAGQGDHVNTIRWALEKMLEAPIPEGEVFEDLGQNDAKQKEEAEDGKEELEEIVVEGLADGVYRLTNYALSLVGDASGGVLSSSKECSRSGFSAEALANIPQGEDGGAPIKWDIKRVQHGDHLYYTIRNTAYAEGGFLTWVNGSYALGTATPTGYYLQAVTDNHSSRWSIPGNKYLDDKDKYIKNGDFWKDILWSISEVPQQRYHILRNLGVSGDDPLLGRLCYTAKQSLSGGQYAQVLHSSGIKYNTDREKYGNGGDFEGSTWWKVSPDGID